MKMAHYNGFILKFLFLLISSSYLAFSDDNTPIPADRAQLQSWFNANVQPLASRAGVDPVLMAAETNPRMIKVRADGSGEFKTITDALASVSVGNANRVIIDIGPGEYREKIRIERTKRFITLAGHAGNMPVIVFDGTAGKYGTLDSATFINEADYFSAVNIVFKNSAPRAAPGAKGQQAVAFRISGEKAAMYGCRFLGFQDTLCDDMGRHFFKDCYIEGTVDFIFGNGKSLYLNCELHVIPGDNVAMVTAQAKHNGQENAGYSFVHCKITGGGPGIAFLGRAWMPYSSVAFSFCEFGDVVHPEGWSDYFHPENDKTIHFAEYSNTGPGSNLEKRASFTKKLSGGEAKPFITLGFIEGSSWLLPPHV